MNLRIKQFCMDLLQHSLVFQGRSLLFRLFVIFSVATCLAITMVHIMEKGQQVRQATIQDKNGSITSQNNHEPTKPGI